METYYLLAGLAVERVIGEIFSSGLKGKPLSLRPETEPKNQVLDSALHSL